MSKKFDCLESNDFHLNPPRLDQCFSTRDEAVATAEALFAKIQEFWVKSKGDLSEFSWLTEGGPFWWDQEDAE